MSGPKERLTAAKTLLMDGATGTELNRRGVATDLPLWSASALITAPGALRQVHADYLAAGAQMITANTFRTHGRSLAAAGLQDRAWELTELAVRLAREAVAGAMASVTEREVWLTGGAMAGSPLVAGSLAPLEDCYSPELVPSRRQCEAEHEQMARYLKKAGVDLILVETHNTIKEAKAAARAARATGLPFGVSFTCRSDGRLFSGESVTEAVRALLPLEPDFMGINCTPSTTILSSLSELAEATPVSMPLSAYANIGHTDAITGWTSTDDVGPEAYALKMVGWMEEVGPRLRLIGGCCGTTPVHIKALARMVQDPSFRQGSQR